MSDGLNGFRCRVCRRWKGLKDLGAKMYNGQAKCQSCKDHADIEAAKRKLDSAAINVIRLPQ
jgi:hypothetical protein